MVSLGEQVKDYWKQLKRKQGPCIIEIDGINCNSFKAMLYRLVDTKVLNFRIIKDKESDSFFLVRLR